MTRWIPAFLLSPLLPALGVATPGRGSGGGQDERPDRAVYVPKDLDECFVELKRLLKPAEIEEIRSSNEDDMILHHFGLGMWMRNNWGLWGGSRLAEWFSERGLMIHPDTMSGIILTSFWRHLNNKPIDIDGQLKPYQILGRRGKTTKAKNSVEHQ